MEEDVELPQIGLRYKKDREGDLKGAIHILSQKNDSKYLRDSEAEVARKILIDGLVRELTEGVLAQLPPYLSKKQKSQYEKKPLNVIRQMIIKNGLDQDIQDWLDEVNR